jgi:hypothetical protein
MLKISELKLAELCPEFVYLGQKGKSDREMAQICGANGSAVKNSISPKREVDLGKQEVHVNYCHFQSRISTKINSENEGIFFVFRFFI